MSRSDAPQHLNIWACPHSMHCRDVGDWYARPRSGGFYTHYVRASEYHRESRLADALAAALEAALPQVGIPTVSDGQRDENTAIRTDARTALAAYRWERGEG